LDLNLVYTLAKGVTVSGGFDYLWAGGYGELATPVAPAAQVPAGAFRMVNNNDDAWQAVWMLQWFF
jgi:hypothetical protein